MPKAESPAEETLPGCSPSLPHRWAPRSWRNWQASLDGAPKLGITEYSLFSDAWFIADARDYGPYSILNTVARTTYRGGSYEWKPALVLRVEHHLPGEHPDMTVTSFDHYHGGWLEDEVAALLALICGARIVAGPIQREFEEHGDPLGRPRAHSAASLPTLSHWAQKPQIPSLQGERDLRDVTLLMAFPALKPEAANALVKAARSYQQALWMADSAPELAWLLFVSAIEIAAAHWDSVELSPAERLERSFQQVVHLLRENGQEALIDPIAHQMHKVIGSTSKFIGFCRRFKPDAPAERPEFGLFDFGDANFRQALAKIYDYRSKALHGGTPFPHPMCDPPQSYSDDGPVEERPTGLAASSYGATWLAEDLPMYLHLFAHITRGTLLNWWRTLTPSAAQSGALASKTK
jgi:hypothetical protein